MRNTGENTSCLTYKETILLTYFGNLTESEQDEVIDYAKELYRKENDHEEDPDDYTGNNDDGNSGTC